MVNIKIYDVTAWLTNNATNILPNILRSKDKQLMKFGQLIKYNMQKNVFEKPHTKCDGETISRSFSKMSKLSIFLNQ